jgi:lipopolysaccharide export system protein LptA
MTSDDNSRIVTFTGRVIARQDDLIITCDLMRVHYQPAGGPVYGPSGVPPEADLAQSRQVAASDTAPGSGTGAGAMMPPLPPSATDDPPTVEGNQGQTGGTPLEGGQEIYRIDCEGSVKIQQRDRLAVGQKALYLAKSEPRRLILTGDARIWEAGNSVIGHQVIYYLDQNRSQVESRQNQRVRAFYDEKGGSK